MTPSVIRRFYISGPINSVVEGLAPDECRARFYRVAEWVRANKWWWETVNPLEVPVECIRPKEGRLPFGEEPTTCGGPFDGHDYSCWMRGDLKALLDCHSMIMLPHWEESRGAKLEYAVGLDMGLTIYHAKEDGEVVIP
jgi:hypothetical protein